MMKDKQWACKTNTASLQKKTMVIVALALFLSLCYKTKKDQVQNSTTKLMAINRPVSKLVSSMRSYNAYLLLSDRYRKRI